MKHRVASSWQGALLVCEKCDRKLDGGFGPKGRTGLAKALAKHPAVGRRRKAALGLARVPCLGICPKGAVTVVDSRAPDRWHLVRPGDDLDALVAGGPHRPVAAAAVTDPAEPVAATDPAEPPVLFSWQGASAAQAAE